MSRDERTHRAADAYALEMHDALQAGRLRHPDHLLQTMWLAGFDVGMALALRHPEYARHLEDQQFTGDGGAEALAACLEAVAHIRDAQ